MIYVRSDHMVVMLSYEKNMVLMISPFDMTVEKGWLDYIIRLMEKYDKIGLIGPKRMLYGTNNIIDGIGGNLYLCGRVKPIATRVEDNGQWDKILDNIDYIGGVMIIRKKVLKKIGLWDPGYYIFSEDVDLCYRIRGHDHHVLYVPNSIIYHKGQVTLKGKDPRGDYLEYMSNRSRIRCGLIHYIKMRVLAMLLIDAFGILLANPKSKILLMKGYIWNLKNIGDTLKRRIKYGPSPPYACKPPLLYYGFSKIIKVIKNKTSN